MRSVDVTLLMMCPSRDHANCSVLRECPLLSLLINQNIKLCTYKSKFGNKVNTNENTLCHQQIIGDDANGQPFTFILCLKLCLSLILMVTLSRSSSTNKKIPSQYFVCPRWKVENTFNNAHRIVSIMRQQQAPPIPVIWIWIYSAMDKQPQPSSASSMRHRDSSLKVPVHETWSPTNFSTRPLWSLKASTSKNRWKISMMEQRNLQQSGSVQPITLYHAHQV